MQEIFLSNKNKKTILALGAESAGNFSVFNNGKIYFSDNFGDILDEKNFKNFQKAVLDFLKKNKLRPNVILTDLHLLYKTTTWGAELAKKFSAKHVQVQHHIAHIFSAVGEKMVNLKSQPPNSFFGVALDGTGYGSDGKIWGGEVFQISNLCIKRIGHLENQIMIGGDLAVKEPARMIVSILSKFLKREEIYKYVKKYYTRKQFELLYNQLQNNFNCVETSSTGRVLDAVSILLGFCDNKRNYKHEPIDLLEKNSGIPYTDLNPKIKKLATGYCLLTTNLFKYLIKNLHRDKRRLTAIVQFYIARGLYEIIKVSNHEFQIYFAGGLANNKIISNFLISKKAITNKKVPRGDAGLSFGQIIYYLSTNPRN